jgi:predicted nucleic acid-binding Zn ribbon protein
MRPQYRLLAKERLAKAATLLETETDDNLVYACLELRKCIEALSYELLTSYLSEVPLKAVETWQPDKVMKELLSIDPGADRTARIRIREEGRDGAPDGPWKELGEDRRLKASWASKAYHQLGNFLHVPTIKQAGDGITIDAEVARKRADAIREQLAYVLDASIWNANFSVSVTITCTECDAPIKRRISTLEKSKLIECGNCGQLFDAELKSDGRYLFVPVLYSWNCHSCGEPRSIVHRNLKEGADVSCPKCGDGVTLHLEQKWVLVRDAEKAKAAAGEAAA